MCLHETSWKIDRYIVISVWSSFLLFQLNVFLYTVAQLPMLYGGEPMRSTEHRILFRIYTRTKSRTNTRTKSVTNERHAILSVCGLLDSYAYTIHKHIYTQIRLTHTYSMQYTACPPFCACIWETYGKSVEQKRKCEKKNRKIFTNTQATAQMEKNLYIRATATR